MFFDKKIFHLIYKTLKSIKICRKSVHKNLFKIFLIFEAHFYKSLLKYSSSFYENFFNPTLIFKHRWETGEIFHDYFSTLRSFNNSARQTGRCVSISSRFQGGWCSTSISHFSLFPSWFSLSLPPQNFLLYPRFRIVDRWFWWIDWNFRYKLLSTDVAVVSLLTAARIIFEAWFLRTSMDGNASKLLMRDAHAYPAQCTYAGHDFRPTISTSCACLFEGGVSGFITLFDMDSFKLSNALRFFSLLLFPSLVVLLLHSHRGKVWIEFVSSF